MGLDSIWIFKDKKKHHPKFNPKLNLVGGMFSCHGKYSFRGKVYNTLIIEITGVSLYQECIPNAVIKQMSKKLSAFKMTDKKWGEYQMYSDQPLSEFNDIVRMFKEYADAGACLIGWW